MKLEEFTDQTVIEMMVELKMINPYTEYDNFSNYSKIEVTNAIHKTTLIIIACIFRNKTTEKWEAVFAGVGFGHDESKGLNFVSIIDKNEEIVKLFITDYDLRFHKKFFPDGTLYNIPIGRK